MSALPEWLTVGAPVAILASGGRVATKPRHAKVDRIGKRDIVLDDGQRFRVRDLSRDNGGGVWNTVTYRLFEPSDPLVTKDELAYVRAVAISRARKACEEFARGEWTAADTILALAPLTGVTDEIVALFKRGEA